MKKFAVMFVFAALIVVAASPPGYAGELQYRFKVGDSLRYKCIFLETRKGRAETTSEVDTVIKVFKELPNGKFRVSCKKSYLKGAGDQAKFKRFQDVHAEDTRYFGTLTPRGHIEDITIRTSKTDALLMPSPGSLPYYGWFVFPSKDLKKNGYSVTDGVSHKGFKCAKMAKERSLGVAPKAPSVTPLGELDGNIGEKVNNLRRKAGKRTQVVHFASEEGLFVERRDEFEWKHERKTMKREMICTLINRGTLTPEEIAILLEEETKAFGQVDYAIKIHSSQLKEEKKPNERIDVLVRLGEFFRDRSLSKEKFMPIIMPCLKDESPMIRNFGSYWVLEMVKGDRKLAAHLVPLLDDPDPMVGRYVEKMLPLKLGLRPFDDKEQLKKWWKENKSSLERPKPRL